MEKKEIKEKLNKFKDENEKEIKTEKSKKNKVELSKKEENIKETGKTSEISDKTKSETSPLSEILNALQTKPFLILAGVSGTGKTQIARLIAWAMSEEENIKEKKEDANETKTN